mmetsp:Transcript_16800/g.25397  ORF Transcript_16800/g.25397 Transcript_16800/m.25397 type:complete len:201 (+) Transcript_16800:299-901(+)
MPNRRADGETTRLLNTATASKSGDMSSSQTCSTGAFLYARRSFGPNEATVVFTKFSLLLEDIVSPIFLSKRVTSTATKPAISPLSSFMACSKAVFNVLCPRRSPYLSSKSKTCSFSRLAFALSETSSSITRPCGEFNQNASIMNSAALFRLSQVLIDMVGAAFKKILDDDLHWVLVLVVQGRTENANELKLHNIAEMTMN